MNKIENIEKLYDGPVTGKMAKEKATQKAHQEGITQAFDELNTVAGRIIQTLLLEEGNERYTVIGRVCECINWAHKAQWSYGEFVKDGKLGTPTEGRGSEHV